jgi:DNA-binding transcriptional LysR family regulator
MPSPRLERWIARKLRLRHLEIIAEVYDSRSILKASKRLNVTQPAVTKAVKDIEATLGLQLFERTTRGLLPTVYGEIFARHAKTVLAQLRYAAEELENLRVGYSGHIAVGSLLAASACLLPEAIALLKKDRPAIAITIIDGTYDILLPALTVGDIDMVLGRLPEAGRQAGLLYEELHDEPICLAVRKNHPLAKKKSLSLADLVDQAWVLPVQESSLRRQIEKMFIDEKLALPRNVIASMSILAIRVLLRKSDCIAILPYHVARDDVDQGLLALLPIMLGPLQTPVGAILRAPGDLPPAAKALMECLRGVGRELNAALPGETLEVVKPVRAKRRS